MAQEKKLDLICRKLGIKASDRVFDIGCGWGGFAKFAAERYGCHVTGISISDRQTEYARDFTKGLPAEIVKEDYRYLEGTFDKMLICGMIEHVGCKNYRRIMQMVQRILKENGLFVMEDWHNFGAYYEKMLLAWYPELPIRKNQMSSMTWRGVSKDRARHNSDYSLGIWELELGASLVLVSSVQFLVSYTYSLSRFSSMPLSVLDPIIASKSLLKHPFYVKWTKGELTLQDLRVYAKEYFHLVERIPGIVARVRDRAPETAMRAMIDENRREEEEHVELWKRFAHSLGISQEELASHAPSQKTVDAVESLETLAEISYENGVVGMYALERELPAIAQTKKDGLCAFYGLASEDAQVYFDEHLKEEKHLEVWQSLPLPSCAAAAAQISLAAQNQLLDAVCEECGISMAC